MKDGVSAQDYLDLELLSKQLQQLDSSLDLAQKELQRTKTARQLLDECSDSQELLIPLGSGVFVEAKIADASSVRMAVGAEVLIDRSLDDAKMALEDQIEQLHAQHDRSLQLREQLIDRILALENRIESTIEQKGA